MDELSQFLTESCTYTAHEIIDEETLGTQGLLDDASEHPEGEHIEKEVHETAVHEHVADQLVGHEVMAQQEVQAEHLVQVDAALAEDEGGCEHQHVDDKQVFDDRSQTSHCCGVVSVFDCKITHFIT